jgi:hypothetical protein
MWMPAPTTTRPAAAFTDSLALTDTRNRMPSVSPRTQRTVVDGLRAVARRSRGEGGRRRFEVLLSRRAAAVRDELLGLAALLDITDDPDPSAIDTLLGLLTDGRESPLYNPAVHACELYATLIDVRRRLLRSGGY